LGLRLADFDVLIDHYIEAVERIQQAVRPAEREVKPFDLRLPGIAARLGTV